MNLRFETYCHFIASSTTNLMTKDCGSRVDCCKMAHSETAVQRFILFPTNLRFIFLYLAACRNESDLLFRKWHKVRQKTEVIRQVFFGDFFHDLFTGHWHLLVGVFSTPVSRAAGAIGGIFARRSSHHFSSIEKECGSI